ncbi:MAG TPA: peptidoglycan recognition family protein [Acidobacteriota bacterium]|nr:peptidoglycan recognition family protein [Acidobacteriota bacterium]
MSRRVLTVLASLCLLCLSEWAPLVLAAGSLEISNRYSPRNQRRPRRPDTRYIVLHTTEGGERGSLRKIRSRGEAHYFVTLKGRVYRVIEKSKIAKHAGRSMWEGRSTLDNHSIGIEVVGYHDREINEAQYKALRELVRQLQSYYRIPDRNVLTHSMVAYGRPNRFHPYNHRGRKRCAMVFARHQVRAKLGLEEKPLKDLDVEEGRLAVADPELYRFLFAPAPAESRRAEAPPSHPNVITPGWTAWHIAREHYASADTVYVFPDGRRLAGNQIENWGRIPVGTQVLVDEREEPQGEFEGFLEVEEESISASEVAGQLARSETTIYFLPNGMVRTGREMAARTSTQQLLQDLPAGTRILTGYVYGGHVRSSRPPVKIAGMKWNYPSTFYRFPDGRILSGDEIDDGSIPSKTLVFYQH